MKWKRFGASLNSLQVWIPRVSRDGEIFVHAEDEGSPVPRLGVGRQLPDFSPHSGEGAA
jgi:hypothetical protein